MRLWLDVDEPLVEAVGNTIAEYHRVDSQDLARRVVATVIQVLEDNLRLVEVHHRSNLSAALHGEALLT